MPIEFYCPSCQHLMRTPDSTAGKKGKCPRCGTVTDIPVRSSKAQFPTDEVLSATPATPAGHPAGSQPVDGKIEFPCPECGKLVRTPATAAGKKGICPNCAAVVQIPAAVPEPAPQREPQPKTKSEVGPAPKPVRPAAADGLLPVPPGSATIDFSCPKCPEQFRTPASAVGKKGRCPRCKAVFVIPAESQAPSAAASPTSSGQPKRERFRTSSSSRPQSTPGLTPIPDSGSGLVPLADLGSGLELLPDDSPGLTVLPGAGSGLTLLPDAAGGFTPLPGLGSGLVPLEPDTGLSPLPDPGGLSPLPNDMGLTPLADDPLGSASAVGPVRTARGAGANPFSDAYAPRSRTAAANPYQSPALPSAGFSTRKKKESASNAVVVAPGIAMIVVASLSLLFSLPYVIISAIGVVGATSRLGDLGPEQYGTIVGYVVGGLLVVIAQILALLGGIKMIKFENWGLALTGAIILVLPCTPCCGGLPFGIWAIVVLSLSNVRRMFS